MVALEAPLQPPGVDSERSRGVRISVRVTASADDGAAATAVTVSVVTPAMRTERAEIFMATLPNKAPTWMNLRGR